MGGDPAPGLTAEYAVKAADASKGLNMKDFLAVAKMPRVWLCGLMGVCNYSALIFHGYVTPYLPAGKASIPWIIVTFIVYGLCLYSIKALYFATIDEVMVPKPLAGTASSVISLCTYAPEMFLYTVSGSMVDKYAGTATPLKGYINCFIAMSVLSAIGFVSAMVLYNMNRKARAEAGHA